MFIIAVPKVLQYHYHIRWLVNFGDFTKFGVQTCQPLILINTRGSFVYCYYLINGHGIHGPHKIEHFI